MPGGAAATGHRRARGRQLNLFQETLKLEGRVSRVSEKLLRPESWTWLVRAAWLAYLLVVLVAVLWPSGEEVSGFKETVGPPPLTAEHKDTFLNLVMLLPLTALGLLGWPRLGPWRWLLAGVLFAVAAEATQYALPALTRRASLANVVENSAGAGAGVLLAAALLSCWPLLTARAGRAS